VNAGGRLALVAALALGSSPLAQSMAPPPTPPPIVDAATGVPIEAPVTVLRDPVLNPFLPERHFTWAMGLAAQVVCPLVQLEGRGSPRCFVGPRGSIDFYIGKMTVDFMVGNGMALGLGLELGSPFVQLGGATSPLSLAVRAVARVRVYPGPPSFFGSGGDEPPRAGGGLGVTLSWAISHRTSLQLQVAPEINAVLSSPDISLDLNTSLGLRFAL
jgi:hypothetical protein